jgi:GT2 family glycosyltransferase
MVDGSSNIAIILVMYRQKNNLDALYSSLSLQRYRNFRIYFVDNNPDDADIEHSKKLNEKYTFDIDYIKPGYNSGFAAGNNTGAKKAIENGSEFIFFLNNDNELDNDCLENLVSALKSDHKAGAAAPLIFFGNDKTTENIIQEFGENCDFDKYKIIKNFEMKKLDEVENILPFKLECNLLSGGAVMFKSSVLKQTGLWEERYFAYGDEIDLFRRLCGAGFSALAVSNAKLYHHHKWDKDNKQGYYFEYYLIERNKFLYFHKHRLHGAMFLMLLADFIKFPKRLLWFRKVCDTTLGYFYLKGMFAGLFNRKGKPGLNL